VGTPRYIRRVPDDEISLPPMIEVRPGYFRASWPMAAAAVILDEEDRVLLVRPAYHFGRWLMPGGGAEPADSRSSKSASSSVNSPSISS
jgi:hypothetical protein